MFIRTIPASKRFLELDVLRTIAIVMMVIYHIMFDLTLLDMSDVQLTSGAWKLMQQFTAHLFLLLVGISFVLSWKRSPDSAKNIKRAIIIYGCGILITLVTLLILPGSYIRFGILHCIGMSIVFLPLFRPLNEWNIPIGLAIILLRDIPRSIRVDTEALLPLGLRPFPFSSVDYFPLIPWLGVILIGLGIGHFLYVRTPWRHRFPIGYQNKLLKALLWPGRHALLVYMVHQPIILVILYATHIAY